MIRAGKQGICSIVGKENPEFAANHTNSSPSPGIKHPVRNLGLVRDLHVFTCATRGLGLTPSCHPFSTAHPRCLTGNDVIQAAIADVVGPAVTTHNPEAAASEHIFPGELVTGSPSLVSVKVEPIMFFSFCCEI